MFCSKCGTQYEGNYCPNGCDSPKQVCPKCKTEYAGAFCPKCGRSAAETPPKKPPKKKRLPTWGLVLIIVFVVLAIVIGIGNAFGKKTEPSESLSASESDRSFPESSLNDPEESSDTELSNSSNSLSSESQSESFDPANYEEISWKTLARDPDAYVDRKIKVVVKVFQVLEGGFMTESGLRAYQDYDLFEHETYLQEEWYIPFDVNESKPKILNSDIVTFYGTFKGTKQLDRAFTGAKESVPTMSVEGYQIMEAE